MLKRPRPARATRIAGLSLVAAVSLAFAWTAWASQSPRPRTVASDGGQINATLRVDVGGARGKPVRIVHPLGSAFEIADGAWRTTFVADATADGDVALAATIREGERIVGEPSVVARPGEPFAVVVGDAGHASFRVEGTLALAAPVHASIANAAEADDTEAGYRAVKPPIYPAEAIRDRAEGTVVLSVTIGKDGSVRAASVDHARPEAAAAIFGAAAIEAVKTWTFDPARSGGVAVESEALVPVEFSLHGSAGAAAVAGEPGALDTITVRGEAKR